MFSVDTWPSGDLIGQNYMEWQAKESAQRYQTTVSAAILLAEVVGWEWDYRVGSGECEDGEGGSGRHEGREVG